MLETIRGCVCQDRQKQYGDAEDNFACIADYWSLWLQERGVLAPGKRVEPTDVAMMSALIKVARASVNPTYLDNWIDLGGYAVCGAGIVTAASAQSYSQALAQS